MSLNTIHASTQDNTGGTQVATITPEVGSGAVQAFAQIGHKTTWPETPRTGLTTDDTGTTDLSSAGFGSTGLCDLENALTVAVRASCNTAAATLVGRLIFYDGSGNPIGTSEQLSFTSDSALRLSASGDYICQRLLRDAGQARKCRFYVDSLSAGTWSVYTRPV